jgi:hypothetical protein
MNDIRKEEMTKELRKLLDAVFTDLKETLITSLKMNIPNKYISDISFLSSFSVSIACTFLANVSQAGIEKLMHCIDDEDFSVETHAELREKVKESCKNMHNCVDETANDLLKELDEKIMKSKAVGEKTNANTH